MAKSKPIIAMAAPVTITAGEGEGENKGPAKFNAQFYTGGAMDIEGWESPVVIDLAGLDHGNVLVANLDHDRTKRVGNFQVANDGKTLTANGTASAATPWRDEVVNSAADGYEWQASLEVRPKQIEAVKAGKTIQANGQEFTGPLFVTRTGTLKGFAFVSHGADDNTSVTIAAGAASKQENIMRTEVAAWLAKTLPSVDVEALSADEIANLEADYDGRDGKRQTATRKVEGAFAERKAEAQRRRELREIANRFIDIRGGDGADVEEVEAIERLYDDAVESKMSTQDFRTNMYETSIPPGHTVYPSRFDRNGKLTDDVLAAAICQAGNLSDLDKHYDDRTLQLAYDQFKGRIGLKQTLLLAAESHGHKSSYSTDVTREVLEAAFTKRHMRDIHGTGFSTLNIANVLAATANKFLHEGWMAVDQTPLRVSAIRNVRNFKTHTTVSLTGDLQYTKVGNAGEIKHGTLADLTYTNKAETYATMLAITRTDIINDDLGALAMVPRRLGRGAMLKLNDIFWTLWLGAQAAGFFASGNSNLNEGVADMTLGGLAATEVMFMNQTDPDGKPLGISPAIILVPTALKAAAMTLMDSERTITGASATLGDANIWRGRFRVESSPYMANSAYTGYSAIEWYMLADPNVLAAVEIAALNGQVEPTVETADADFNVLGIQMRGYSDVGVALQEYRAAVEADGNAS